MENQNGQCRVDRHTYLCFMSNKDSYLQPVDTRKNIDLSDHTIQDIIKKHPLPLGNNSDNCGTENSDTKDIMAVNKQEMEGLFKKFVKTKTIHALDPNTFSGNTNDNANEWINKFEDYCEIQKISEDKEKILIFSALLKSGAHCWFKNLSDGKKQHGTVLKITLKRAMVTLTNGFVTIA